MARIYVSAYRANLNKLLKKKEREERERRKRTTECPDPKPMYFRLEISP